MTEHDTPKKFLSWKEVIQLILFSVFAGIFWGFLYGNFIEGLIYGLLVYVGMIVFKLYQKRKK